MELKIAQVPLSEKTFANPPNVSPPAPMPGPSDRSFDATNFAPGVLNRLQTLWFANGKSVKVYAEGSATADKQDILYAATKAAANTGSAVFITRSDEVIVGNLSKDGRSVNGHVFSLAPVASAQPATGPKQLKQTPPELTQALEVAKRATVRVAGEEGSGSGVLIRQQELPDGSYKYWVLTNAHVAGAAGSKSRIELGGNTYEGRVITSGALPSPRNPDLGAFNQGTDVSVIEFVTRERLTVAKLAPQPVPPGDPVLVAGFPSDGTGYVKHRNGLLTLAARASDLIPDENRRGGGYGQGLRPYDKDGDPPQVNGRNSGGPVLNAQGDVVGIVGQDRANWIMNQQPRNRDGNKINQDWYKDRKVNSLFIPITDLKPFLGGGVGDSGRTPTARVEGKRGSNDNQQIASTSPLKQDLLDAMQEFGYRRVPDFKPDRFSLPPGATSYLSDEVSVHTYLVNTRPVGNKPDRMVVLVERMSGDNRIFDTNGKPLQYLSTQLGVRRQAFRIILPENGPFQIRDALNNNPIYASKPGDTLKYTDDHGYLRIYVVGADGKARELSELKSQAEQKRRGE